MSFLKKLQENRAEKVQEMETLVNTAKTEEPQPIDTTESEEQGV